MVFALFVTALRSLRHTMRCRIEDPKQIAVYPLAVPYLVNPAGITILIIASGEIVPGLCQHRHPVTKTASR
jgi:small neutral amino acid transporter SnatA (MarC family)